MSCGGTPSAIVPLLLAANGVAAPPGVQLYDWGGIALQPNAVRYIDAITYMGVALEDVALFLTPTIASPLSSRFYFMRGTSTDNEHRSCIPVYADAVTRVPWIIGIEKSGAGNANVQLWYHEERTP